MSTGQDVIEDFANQEYKYGFVTDIESDAARRAERGDHPLISSKKGSRPGSWNGA